MVPQFLNTIQVLLYNFFKDSHATANQWRLVKRSNSNGMASTSVPDFNETKHASICMEVLFFISPHPSH